MIAYMQPSAPFDLIADPVVAREMQMTIALVVVSLGLGLFGYLTARLYTRLIAKTVSENTSAVRTEIGQVREQIGAVGRTQERHFWSLSQRVTRLESETPSQTPTMPPEEGPGSVTH